MDQAKIKAAREAIKAERQRQLDVEGWTPEHDDRHDDGSLLRAAVFYFQHGARKDFPLHYEKDGAPTGWPWDAKWWKPKTPRRDLERAGALAMAERDRLRRLHRRTEPALHKLRLIINALAELPDAA